MGSLFNNIRETMTPLFWQKRLSGKLTATLLFLAVMVIVCILRRPIAIKVIEHFTQSQDIYITCLDFSFDWRLNLNIKQACLVSPLGSVVLTDVIWQLWSRGVSVEQVKIKHIEQLYKKNKPDNPPPNEQEQINFPDVWPRLSILSLEIESSVLLQPLALTVNTISPNELSITGDINASVKINPNTLLGSIDWRLSDLTKWVPQAQKYSLDNAELLKDLALDESKIKTRLIFDGKMLNIDNSLDLTIRIDVSNCPIDLLIKGNLLVNVDVSSFGSILDISQLSSNVSVEDCPLLQNYFTQGDLPRLSFMFPQKITIDKTKINLPELQIVDKQNTHRSVSLSALKYKTTGELELNYNISLKQPIKTTKIEAEMLHLQAEGSVSADFSAWGTQKIRQPISFKIIDDTNRLVVSALKIDSLLIGNLNSDFSVKGPHFNDLQLSIDNQISQLNHPNISVLKITNHIDLNIKEFETLRFSGESSITDLSAQNINLRLIDVTHSGEGDLANIGNIALSSQHELKLENSFLVALEQQQNNVKVRINQQDIITLQSIISQFENTVQIKEGNLTANIEFTLPQKGEPFIAQGSADFHGLSVKYQDYLLNNITYQTPLTFDSAGLQLPKSTLHIDSIDVGVLIEKITANVIAKNSIPRLNHIQGEIFNGQFSLANLWLDGREQQFNINIQNIELAQIVALQQQPGIQVTGNIDGDLPLIIGTQGIRIEDGWISSLTGGKLTIIDNPSFDSIKVQQPDLALLENIDFSQLESSVKLNPDGWVFFDLSIKGNNPNEKRSVNFNYSHQENIFPLLKSIRLINLIENRIEQKITQGDKK